MERPTVLRLNLMDIQRSLTDPKLLKLLDDGYTVLWCVPVGGEGNQDPELIVLLKPPAALPERPMNWLPIAAVAAPLWFGLFAALRLIAG